MAFVRSVSDARRALPPLAMPTEEVAAADRDLFRPIPKEEAPAGATSGANASHVTEHETLPPAMEALKFLQEISNTPYSLQDRGQNIARMASIISRIRSEMELLSILDCFTEYDFLGNIDCIELFVKVLRERFGEKLGDFLDIVVFRGIEWALRRPAIETLLVREFAKRNSAAYDITFVTLQSLTPTLKKKINSPGKHVLLFNMPGLNEHFTPILIDVQNDGIHVFVTDSLSHGGHDCAGILWLLAKQFPEVTDATPHFYGYRYARQADHGTCSIFAMTDALAFFDDPTFTTCALADTRRFRQESIKDIGRYKVFAKVPVAMLKHTQFRNRADKNYLTLPGFQTAMPQHVVDTLGDHFQHFVDREAQNRSAEGKMSQSLAYVLSEHLKTKWLRRH